MKRLLTLVALFTGLTLAPAGATLAACGVGTTIWEGNDGVAATVLAFTTNVWTFKGLSTTFESSGCTEEDNFFASASANEKIRVFASQNLDHLAYEMARGHGEHLDAFAHLIEVRSEHLASLRSLAQQRFELLFPHEEVTAGEMLRALATLMAEVEALSVYVNS
jgi:hypothetical protein